MEWQLILELQQAEFDSEQYGYTATRHQREVGTGYFDQVSMVVSGGTSSTTALKGSTEAEQFTQISNQGQVLPFLREGGFIFVSKMKIFRFITC